MMNAADGVIRNARVCALVDPGTGVMEDATVAWRNSRIEFVGTDAEFRSREIGETYAQDMDAKGALLTPGLIDCHTHLVYGGQRSNEFEARLAGASYADIARAGGGIKATVRATRALDDDQLFAQSVPRAQALLADGVTTIEIKSGYGLDLETEGRMLRVARRIGDVLGINVRTTALCAHAVPEEFAGNADGYIDLICAQMLPSLAEQGLVDAVDAFCEGIGFTPAQTRRVFAAAQALGLRVKLHADQLSDLGGAQLVAEFAGLSADHVEYTSRAGIDALAQSGAVAVMLPGAFYSLRETRLPPVAQFRSAAVPMAVATDLNPGTSPLASLRVAMNMACVLFGLTVEEALRGVTVNAAKALALPDRGQIRVGAFADLALWPVASPAELVNWIGGPSPLQVIAGGVTRVRVPVTA
ncbi:MAG: imidazolonepropionase [Pseudomarimonas sp.]